MMYNLVDLKKNLKIFSFYLNENYAVIDGELVYNFIYFISDATDIIDTLNKICFNYSIDAIDNTLVFLQENLENLKKEILLKKKKDNLEISFQIYLLELEIKHCTLVFYNITKLKNKEIIDDITMEHVENFCKDFGYDNIYIFVANFLIENFKKTLENYLQTKEYEIFDKETEFFCLQKDMEKNHLTFFKKILQINQYPLFIEQIEKELLELEKKDTKNMKEIEQIFYFFQKEHWNTLVAYLSGKFGDILDLKYLFLFYKNIIVLKQKNYINVKNIPVIFILKEHIQNFRILADKMFIENGNVYILPDLDFISDIVLFKIKYFTELENLLKLLPVFVEEELEKFLKEKLKKTQEKLLNQEVENFEITLLELEINYYEILIKATKTRILEENKIFFSFEQLWLHLVNEKRILTYVFNFIEIISKLRNIKTIQTEEGQAIFSECQDKLAENFKNWENVCQVEKIEDLQKRLEDAFFASLQILEVSDIVDQLVLNIIKKHFGIILKEIKQEKEKKENLRLDFTHIRDFLEEFRTMKK